MKYLIIFILFLILLTVIVFIYLKQMSTKTNISMPNQKANNTTTISQEENQNPTFRVELIDHKKCQLGISKSTKNETIKFKKAQNKRINVYTINKQYIGQIAIKDYKDFSLISKKPNYFEGEISAIEYDNLTHKKVIINVRVKIECSKEVYNIDKNYLNTLITLFSLFSKNEIIETNYGPSTIIEIYNDHLLVEIPSLGNREIYDIENILTNK